MDKINVRKVFRDKNPQVAKMIPGFIFKYIEQIVHQKDLNDGMASFGDQYGLDFIQAIIDYFSLDIVVEGEENIPTTGRHIFVANHPLGGLDGVVFAHVVSQKNPNIKFLVNDILMNMENMDSVFIPVNKHGRQSIEYVRRIEETYESDAEILNFPAGLCSRKIKGQIVDLEWKKSFVTKAVKHKRDVVPAYITGRNSNFFYNLSNLRGWLGIKTNLEMFYLVDEVYKQQDKNIKVIFGESIPYQTFDKSHNAKEWAQKVKEYVYTLPMRDTKPFNVK